MRITQRKGDTAVAQAVATFTRLGYDVLLPLTESAPYDLVVDTPDGLQRVQVRFSSLPDVELRRVHSNAQGFVVKKTMQKTYDWLYILRDNGEEYVIKECFIERRSVRPRAEHRIR